MRLSSWIGLSIVGAALVIGIQMLLPSLLNNQLPFYKSGGSIVDSNFLTEVVQYHLEQPVFALRLAVTAPVEWLHRWGFSSGKAFVTVQFLYVALAIFMLSMLTGFLYKGRKSLVSIQMLSVIAFLLSFTILFAFTTPMYTYDEFAQYAFLFAAIYLGLRKKYLLTSIALLGATVVRETTVLLFPSFLLFLYPDFLSMKKSLMQLQRIKQILIVFFTPIFGYIVYVYVVNFFHAGILKENESYFQTERFTHFFYNFQSSAFGVATIVGLFLVFAIPLFLLFVSKQCSKHLPFFLAVMINTPIALVATRAQEARIFALPLVFLWPYLGAYLYDFITSLPTRIYAYITFWKMVEMRALVMSRLCIVLTILGVYILFIFFVYQSFFMGATVVPYQWYAIVVGISIAFYSLMPTIPSNR